MLKQPSQIIHTSREAKTFRRRFRIPYVFSWAPLLVGDTAEVVSSSATSSTEFDSTQLHTAYTYDGVPTKLFVAHTHNRTVTELFAYEVLLYSSLYLFEYLTGPHTLGPKKIYFGHKILMKPSHDCSY